MKMKKIFKFLLAIFVIWFLYWLISDIYELQKEYETTPTAKREREARLQEIERKEAQKQNKKAVSTPTNGILDTNGFKFQINSWNYMDGSAPQLEILVDLSSQIDKEQYTYILVELNIQNKKNEPNLFKAGTIVADVGGGAPFRQPPVPMKHFEGVGTTKILPAKGAGKTIIVYKFPTKILELKKCEFYYVPANLSSYGLYVGTIKLDQEKENNLEKTDASML